MRCMNSVVSVSHIEKSYGAVDAVADVTLEVGEGEVVALLGPNGAGKTTTIEIMLGLLKADHGDAQLFGESPQAAVAQGRVGAMLQDGGLMAGVLVGELLDMLREQYPDPITVEQALALASLEGLERRRVDRLSGGQAQRLRAACALVGNPELLVLDEPTVAMDVEARRSFWAAMRDKAANGRTILFSTHYLEEADEFADRVVVLGQGRVLVNASPSAIKSTFGLRVLRCTIERPDRNSLKGLPGVASAEIFRQHVELRSSDSDVTLRALLAAFPDVADIEIGGAGLEEAFLALTPA
jgi:ABC-2 type transport system ATP-binding protein